MSAHSSFPDPGAATLAASSFLIAGRVCMIAAPGVGAIPRLVPVQATAPEPSPPDAGGCPALMARLR